MVHRTLSNVWLIDMIGGGRPEVFAMMILVVRSDVGIDVLVRKRWAEGHILQSPTVRLIEEQDLLAWRGCIEVTVGRRAIVLGTTMQIRVSRDRSGPIGQREPSLFDTQGRK